MFYTKNHFICFHFHSSQMFLICYLLTFCLRKWGPFYLGHFRPCFNLLALLLHMGAKGFLDLPLGPFVDLLLLEMGPRVFWDFPLGPLSTSLDPGQGGFETSPLAHFYYFFNLSHYGSGFLEPPMKLELFNGVLTSQVSFWVCSFFFAAVRIRVDGLFEMTTSIPLHHGMLSDFFEEVVTHPTGDWHHWCVLLNEILLPANFDQWAPHFFPIPS